MGQFLGEGNRSDPQKGFEIIPSDDYCTWLASGIAQAAPSNHAQLLHVDLSQFSGNRMYTEIVRYEMFTLSEIQIRLKDTS